MFLYSAQVHDRLRFRRSALGTALLLAVSACGGGDDRSGPPAEPASTPTAPATSSAVPAPSGPAPSSTPAGLATPATTSGPLSQDSFPRPATLGTGWAYTVDPGDAEEGYLGNGTPALERDPDEVVQLAVPFGCRRPQRMPVAQHALEVDYTAAGVTVIAIRQTYTDAAEARAFFTARADNLGRCAGRTAPGVGALVGQVATLRPGVLLSGRTPQSDPWAELAVLDDDQVVLLAARTRVGRPPLTPSGARRLATLFRR